MFTWEGHTCTLNDNLRILAIRNSKYFHSSSVGVIWPVMHIYAFIFGQNQQARPVLKNTRTTTPYLQKYVQNNKNHLLRTCRCAMAQKVTKRQFTRALVHTSTNDYETVHDRKILVVNRVRSPSSYRYAWIFAMLTTALYQHSTKIQYRTSFM